MCCRRRSARPSARAREFGLRARQHEHPPGLTAAVAACAREERVDLPSGSLDEEAPHQAATGDGRVRGGDGQAPAERHAYLRADGCRGTVRVHGGSLRAVKTLRL
ncbi:hypothetical protein ON010_g2730 [Phytophthora cinnamomi]|nr:hypothetical protein ON010_g2730 [Phytophthora cinnamomi]